MKKYLPILALSVALAFTTCKSEDPEPATYSTGFVTNNVSSNGLNATGVVTPTSPQEAATSMTVTVTLAGNATEAGTHTIGVTSATLGSGISAPSSVTKVVTAGEAVSGQTFAFTFTMPEANVNDLVVTHTFVVAPPSTYVIGFTTNSVVSNGLTATGAISPASPQVAATPITVTITLAGTATVAGTHTVGLTSTTLGTAIVAPATVTKEVAKEEAVSGQTYAFTFTMPAGDVNNLVVTHTFEAAPLPTYTIGFTTNNVAINGLTATGAVTPSSPQEAATSMTVNITLAGTATVAGTHTVGLTSVTLGTAIVAPATVTKEVAISEVVSGQTFAFTFTMPAEDVSDLVVTHTFEAAIPPTYDIAFMTNSVSANGLTATGVISPDSPKESSTPMTVTITLAGTALYAGTHTVGLTSAILGTAMVAPVSVTKETANNEVVSGLTFAFTFTMPAGDVTDLVVTHTFVRAPITPENVSTYIQDPNVNTRYNFLNLMNDNGGELSRYQITLGSSKVTDLIANLNSAANTLQEEIRMYAPGSATRDLRFHYILRTDAGGTANLFWNCDMPTLTDAGRNPLTDVRITNANYTYNPTTWSYTSFTGTAGHAAFRSFIIQATGFTILQDGDIFWFRSIADPNDWFKCEPFAINP